MPMAEPAPTGGLSVFMALVFSVFYFLTKMNCPERKKIGKCYPEIITA